MTNPPRPLTAEQVAQMRAFQDLLSPSDKERLCDSHEVLRAALAAETRRAHSNWVGIEEREHTIVIYLGELKRAEAERDRLREQVAKLREAMREIRGFDDPWSHHHSPDHAGHECRMCWILKTVDKALAATAPERSAGSESPTTKEES